jgi:spore coat assembly protein SafA
MVYQLLEQEGVDMKIFKILSHRRWVHLLIVISMLITMLGFVTVTTVQAACGPTHTVQRGESLASIAAACGVSLLALIQANPQIKNPRLIYRGNVINIPGIASSGTGATAVPITGTYTVRRGDTLFSIAQRYGVSVSLLVQANPQISNTRLIHPGQVINLPQGSTIPSTGQPTVPIAGIYSVRRGDTMLRIAQAHGISVSALVQANPQIGNPSLIFPGEVINLPEGSSIPSTNTSSTPSVPIASTYTVRFGDTMFRIAQRFGVSLTLLIQANPQIANPRLIFAGQQINIPEN